MMDKLSNVLLPIAEKLSKNRYLTAIRDGFVSIMPLVITASLFTLINSVFVGEGITLINGLEHHVMILLKSVV
ncbi:MAG: hypothetical protein ACLSWA_00120 [Thomasclavelia spiroformis]